MRKSRAWAAMLAVTLGLGARAASATSCDMATINARSVEETAEELFRYSDYLGFAFVRQVEGAPAVLQQEVDMFHPLKGDVAVIRMAPERVNGVSRGDGLQRWFYWKPDDIHLVALVRTPEGAAVPVCLAASIAAKPKPALYRALIRIAQDRSRAQGRAPA
jgi:hypothetical protein